METEQWYARTNTGQLLLQIILVFSTLLSGYGQQIGDLPFQVGRTPSPVLGKAMFMAPRFHGRIGGIDFNQTAELDPSLAGKRISIAYNSSNPDGSRLEIWSGPEKIGTPYLPDWQLVPIANFAASEYSSVISIFGKAIDEDTTEIVYHPAFIHTLLGWRLLQSDIMLKYPDKMWHFPQDKSGILSGAGEKAPDVRDSAYYLSISATLGYILRSAIYKDGPLDSWVYTDYQQKVTIQSDCGQLRFSGSPYYYFTFTNYNQYYNKLSEYFKRVDKLGMTLDEPTKAVLTRLQSLYIDLQEEQIREDDIKQGYLNARRAAIQARRDTSALWENTREALTSSAQKSKDISIDLYDYTQENKQLLAANPGLQQIVTFSPVLEKEYLTNLIRTAYPEILQRLNPAVYQATKNTMQFAAFFRYVRQNNPETWEKFINGIKTVPAGAYSVPTPYEIGEPGGDR